MNDIDLSQIDLNLLVALNALLEEGSVTRAAARTGVGQPAMSHTLGRLRELLDDPLFVRAGRSLEPTPRAAALDAPVRRLLRDVRDVLSARPDFDPSNSERQFSVICPDAFGNLLPSVLENVSKVAPRIQLRIFWPRRDPAEALADGQADIAIAGPHAEVPGIVRRGLGNLDWMIAMRADHPAATGEFTMEKWLEWPHIVIESGARTTNILGSALERAGYQRRVGVTLPSLLMGPLVAARTDLFYAVPRTLVQPLVENYGLILREPPLDIPPAPVVALWPERLAEEPAHRWLRETMIDEFTALL